MDYRDDIYKIEEEKILDYLPLSQKRFWILKGIERILDDSNGIFTIDPLAQELFLYLVLFGVYFGCKLTEAEDSEGKPITMFGEADYDYIKEHELFRRYKEIENQKDESGFPTELAKKMRRAFSDYSLFVKLLITSLNNELTIRNDLAERIVNRMIADLSPESMEKAQTEAKILIEAIEKRQMKQ